ncbi:hypothetical protein yc1106_09140 [Curvularia clavata]|uniref:Tim10-like domain-containing protein n=1 Tax=Curvularia clavata TaxID=95742 RepID=A0A9Q8ZEK8_CURCL|nr:hypothetical protein yc1106_09140 [Curvularia clavata]
MGEYRHGHSSRYSKMRSILIINPNSTEQMTNGLKPLVDALQFKETAHEYFTAPSGPKSINNEEDAAESVKHCLPALQQDHLTRHDGFLVACYSQHPLVPILKEQSEIRNAQKPVTGIFEASVSTSLQLIHPEEKFGIVSTGKVWETILSDATIAFLGTGSEASKRFAGVETTGLNATDLHDAPAEEVRKRMKDAVKRLLKKGKALPNELLAQIAAHLDQEPPSITKFSHEPSELLTHSDCISLKSLSQVSWRWRKIVLPILFRYSRIPLDDEPQWVPMDARLVDSMQENLTKLSNHEFLIYTKLRSKFKSSSVFAFEPAMDDVLINLCRIQEGDEFLKSVPNILWLPHLPKSFANFCRFVAHYTLKHHIRSVVVHTKKEYELRHVSTADLPLARGVSDIWTQVFSHLEPTRVIVAAPPSTMAGLLDTQMMSNDTWAFEMKMHYIELLQDEPPRTEHMKENCRTWGSALIHQRPWYHVGYNEGSSIAAYSTYEYHLKQSPKILFLLLIRLAKETQPCCNITSFSFTGVFPFAANVTSIVRALHRIPTVKKIRVQLAPGPENNLLSDGRRRGRAQSSDFWLEWRESYKVLASYLGVFDFADEARFTSRDCHGKQLAIEVEESSEQRELQSRMEKKQMKEFMNMYSNLVQQCFDHCVNGFESKSLTSREESCVMRCVDKHMKGSQRLGDRFQEQNAAMAQGGGMGGR